MTKDTFKKIISMIPEEDLPKGHLQHFKNRLNLTIPIEQKLWNIQRLLIAASVAALIAGTLLFFAFYNQLAYNTPMLAGSPTEFYETEMFYKNLIENKIEILSKSNKISREVFTDIKKVDESFKSMRRDIKKNPGDMRLIGAVLETYQVKIDFLDEVLEKTR